MSHTCYGHNRRKNTCFRYKGNPLTYREVKLKDNMENTSFFCLMSTIFLRENERYLPVKEQFEPQINAILEEFLVFDTETAKQAMP